MVESARKGIVTRVSRSGIAIMRDKASNEDFGFTFDKIKGYGGQYPEEIGLVKGIEVDYSLSELDKRIVDSVNFTFADRRPKLFGRWVLPWATNS